MMSEPVEYRCSFCGKTARECSRLIAGPAAFICDECVGLCADILVEGTAASPPLVSIAGSVKRLHDVDRMAAEIAKLSRVKDLRDAAVDALFVARKALDDAAEAFDVGTVAKCYWCGAVNRGDDIKAHSAICDRHPAVIKLREVEVKRERKAARRG